MRRRERERERETNGMHHTRDISQRESARLLSIPVDPSNPKQHPSLPFPFRPSSHRLMHALPFIRWEKPLVSYL